MSHINAIWTIQKINIWNIFILCVEIFDKCFPFKHHVIAGTIITSYEAGTYWFFGATSDQQPFIWLFKSSYIKKGHNRIFCYKVIIWLFEFSYNNWPYGVSVHTNGFKHHIAVSNLEIIYLTWNMYLYL